MITLNTLHKATAQEVFDQVATHLLTQNKQSLGVRRLLGEGASPCMYRGPDHLMCAAGCLIADDEYDSKMEATIWPHLISQGWVPTDAHHELIYRLQTMHDNNSPDQWLHMLEDVAVDHRLDGKVLGRFSKEID